MQNEIELANSSADDTNNPANAMTEERMERAKRLLKAQEGWNMKKVQAMAEGRLKYDEHDGKAATVVPSETKVADTTERSD